MSRSPDVFWVLQNGDTSIRDGLVQSLSLANQRSEAHATAIELAALIILVCAEALIAILVFAVLIPAVARVQTTQHRVYQSFLETPMAILRALRDISTKKSEAARAALSDDDTDGEGVGFDVFDASGGGHASGGGFGAGGDGERDGEGGEFGFDQEEDGVDAAYVSLQGALTVLKDKNKKMNAAAKENAGGNEEERRGCAAWCRRRGTSAAAEDTSRAHKERSYRRNKSGISVSGVRPMKQVIGSVLVALLRDYLDASLYIAPHPSPSYSNAAFHVPQTLLIQLLWPLLVLAAYFAGSYIMTDKMVHRSRNIRAEK